MKKLRLVIISILVMVTAQSAFAGEDGHHHMGSDMQGDHNKAGMKEHGHMKGEMSQMASMQEPDQMKETFLVKKEVDGFIVSFHARRQKMACSMVVHTI